MPTLTSPGIGANLDVKGIVSQLMTAEQKTVVQLNKKEASYQAKLSAFGSLKSVLSNLQTAAQTLNLNSTFSSVKASVADATILSATTSGAAAAGNYNIEVKSLAQAQKLTSTGFAAKNTVVGSGTLTLDFGTYSDAGSPPVTFTANPDVTQKVITIDSSNNTLEGIRDAINAANTGVTATLINDGTHFRLALTGKETGAANAVRIGVAETGGAGLARLAYDASAGGVSNMTQNVAARDAVIKVDGITVTKPGNTITDAIQGVTLNLSKETAEDTTTKLTVTRDTSTIRNAIDGFVKAYNAVNKQITDATAYNASTGVSSVLTGDATVRSVQTQLRNTLSTVIGNAPAGLRMMSDAGISFQKDGSLSVDSAKLDKALADPSKDLSRLFATSADGTVGFASKMNTLVSDMIFGKEAILNGRIDGITSSIKDITARRTQENVRLAGIEKRYLAQFTALDTMIANMSKTSSFLTQQLESMKASLRA